LDGIQVAARGDGNNLPLHGTEVSHINQPNNILLGTDLLIGSAHRLLVQVIDNDRCSIMAVAAIEIEIGF
jgi:hypothetical protein